MDTKHQVHNLIILDESGSMGSIKSTIIRGFNEIVQTVRGIAVQFPEQEHFISLITFNGLATKTHLWLQPVTTLELIDENKYRPDANTPLYDAMGQGITSLKNTLLSVKNCNVLVTILTDGEENASMEYSGAAIKKMIEELKRNNWTFAYIGADHDVEKFALSISITNTMKFDKTDEGIKSMFAEEANARMSYSLGIRNKKNTTDDFYKKKK